MRARRHLAETTRQPAGEVVGSHRTTKEEPNMKAFIAVLLTAALAFAGGHAATVSTMEIETDGDCDSAFVTTLGREYFVGANGYEVD